MVPTNFLNRIKKHTPLFSSIYSQPSPFLDRAFPIMPNKIKFILDSDEQSFDPNVCFGRIGIYATPGMYFVIPSGDNALTLQEFEVLESAVLDKVTDNQFTTTTSLKTCKAFAHKFESLGNTHPVVNSFKVAGGRLYITSKRVCLANSYLCLEDYSAFLMHLLNFIVVGTNADYLSPFFSNTLKTNRKIIEESLSTIRNTLCVSYSTNKYSSAPTLNFKSESFEYTFDLSDKESLTDFILPSLFSTFRDDTDINSYLVYRG